MLFEIEASSFCHQMVRSVVGTLVEVGGGRRKAGEMTSVVAARDRTAAGPVAPPHGLCLWEVKYPAVQGGPVVTPAHREGPVVTPAAGDAPAPAS